MKISVTARNDVVGGTPRPELMFNRRFFRAQGLDRIILVHGFRVPEESARNVYDAFLAKARDTGTDLGERYYGMTWPGDDGWLVDPFYFRHSEDQADICANLLADHLEQEIREGIPLRYIFVAHSLGCRLVVRTMAEVARRLPNLRDRFVVFLMAAAVPGEMLAPGTPERNALGQLCRAYPLSSMQDRVLRDIFPAGRFFRSEEAVGRCSRPYGSHWTETPWLELDQVTEGMGHSDYWNDTDGLINTYIARRLGLAPSAPLPGAFLAGTKLAARNALPSNSL